MYNYMTASMLIRLIRVIRVQKQNILVIQNHIVTTSTSFQK